MGTLLGALQYMYAYGNKLYILKFVSTYSSLQFCIVYLIICYWYIFEEYLHISKAMFISVLTDVVKQHPARYVLLFFSFECMAVQTRFQGIICMHLYISIHSEN